MSDFRLPITCEQFEDRISDYIDGTMSMSDRAIMDAHASECEQCAIVLAEVGDIVREAAILPALTPSRDLWQGIANRLDTPVLSIASAGTPAIKVRRAMSFRTLAAAAALLVSVSSGATYLLMRAPTTSPTQTPQVASTATTPVQSPATAQRIDSTPVVNSTRTGTNANAGVATGAPNVGASGVNTGAEVGERTRTRYASNNGNSVELVYEREITAMRRIVDERLGDLDSTTVLEIERNLRIIDKAISDSRRALQNDPRSRFLSSQLDRALENKLDVLRRIALL